MFGILTLWCVRPNILQTETTQTQKKRPNTILWPTLARGCLSRTSLRLALARIMTFRFLACVFTATHIYVYVSIHAHTHTHINMYWQKTEGGKDKVVAHEESSWCNIIHSERWWPCHLKMRRCSQRTRERERERERERKRAISYRRHRCHLTTLSLDNIAITRRDLTRGTTQWRVHITRLSRERMNDCASFRTKLHPDKLFIRNLLFFNIRNTILMNPLCPLSHICQWNPRRIWVTISIFHSWENK